MPLKHPVIFLLNHKFTNLGEDYDPGDFVERLGDGTTLLDLAAALDLADEAEEAGIDPDQLADLIEFIQTMPPSIDVAIVAALRSAFERGFRAQITWQPGYDWELRVWEVSDAGTGHGVLDVFVTSPNPDAVPTS
jgi:hypothetical protein